MKKAIIVFAAILICSLTACSANSNANDSSSRIVTTTVAPTIKATQPTTQEETTIEPTTEEITTEAPTQPPTDPPTAPPTDPPKDNRWKSLYINFINSLNQEAISGYQLIFIDDDETPELVAMGISHIAPSYLCWVNDGKLCQCNVSFSGFAYFEKQNKYICEEGSTGKGWDYVRRINGDEAEDLIKGELCTVQGQEYYRWDGVDYSSREQYEAAKNSDFDKNFAQTISGLKSYSEICQQIKDF